MSGQSQMMKFSKSVNVPPSAGTRRTWYTSASTLDGLGLDRRCSGPRKTLCAGQVIAQLAGQGANDQVVHEEALELIRGSGTCIVSAGRIWRNAKRQRRTGGLPHWHVRRCQALTRGVKGVKGVKSASRSRVAPLA